MFLNPVDFVVLITSDLACQNIVQAGSGEGLEVVQNHFDGHMNRILFAELQHPSKVENPQKRETKGEAMDRSADVELLRLSASSRHDDDDVTLRLATRLC